MRLNQNSLRKKIYLFLGIISGIISLGISGYMIIEGWSFVDALYMTTITIATVGYSEVNGLSTDGKIFTIFLIFISFGNFAFAITSLTRYVVEGDYKRDLRELRVLRNLRKMKKHVIVTGFGRVGQQVVNDLVEHKMDVVVIEKDQLVVDGKDQKANFQFIQGNATKDNSLSKAGIENASAIVTCLPSDSDNLYIVLGAREFNKNIQIIARASSHEAVAKLYLAGATNVVMPDSIGGAHMASLIANPLIADFLELISESRDGDGRIECIQFKNIPESLLTRTIDSVEIKKMTGANIVGVRKPDGKFILNPCSEQKILEGLQIFVLGTNEQVLSLKGFFGI